MGPGGRAIVVGGWQADGGVALEHWHTLLTELAG
jgi:hypothetical protein